VLYIYVFVAAAISIKLNHSGTHLFANLCSSFVWTWPIIEDAE
jgi:hypothetical protein